MIYKVIVTKSALEDIRSAVRYISDTLMNKEAANNLLDELDGKIGLLSEQPYINPLVRDSFLASNGFRIQSVNNYLAFYNIHEETKTVSVIRFQHSRRDWISLLKNTL